MDKTIMIPATPNVAGIKNIVFDLGGVLIKNNFRVNANNMDISDDDLLYAWRKYAEVDTKLGKDETTTREKYIEEYKKCFYPRLQERAEELLDLFWASNVPFEYVDTLLSSLKVKGYKLYYLSNWSKASFEASLSKGAYEFIDKYMEGGIVSYREGLMKPDVRIYDLLLERYNLVSPECLFLDDRPENIMGAQKAGMLGMVWEESGQALEVMRSLPDINIIEEAAVAKMPAKYYSPCIEKSDAVYNMENWKGMGGHNILYITGISGSGKTTLANDLQERYNIKRIELDDIVASYLNRVTPDRRKIIQERAESNCPGVGEFFTPEREKKYHLEEWAEFADVTNDFIYWFLYTTNHLNDGELYIMNGAQIPYIFKENMAVDCTYFRDKPIIIKHAGGKSLLTTLRRTKREIGDSANIKDFMYKLKRNLGFLKNSNYIKGMNDMKHLSDSIVGETSHSIRILGIDPVINGLTIRRGNEDPVLEKTVITCYINESNMIKSKLDTNYKSKGKKSLSSFKHYPLTKTLQDKYKKDSTLLAEEEDVSKGKGIIYLDRDNEMVAFIYTEKFADGLTWLCGIEITPKYRGYGLSKQLVKASISSLGAEALGVHNTNEVAMKVYEDCGFKYGTSEIFTPEAKRLCKAMYTKQGADKLEKSNIKEEFVIFKENIIIDEKERYSRAVPTNPGSFEEVAKGKHPVTALTFEEVSVGYEVDVATAIKDGGFYGKDKIWNSLVEYKGKLYRKRTEAIIFNDKGEIFAEIKDDKTVKLPGGSTERGMTDIASCEKEIEEEMKAKVINLRDSLIEYRQDDRGTKPWMKDQFSIKYDGRITHIYLAEYDKPYKGYIAPADRDDLYKKGKWYSYEELKHYLNSAQVMAIEKDGKQIAEGAKVLDGVPRIVDIPSEDSGVVTIVDPHSSIDIGEPIFMPLLTPQDIELRGLYDYESNGIPEGVSRGVYEEAKEWFEMYKATGYPGSDYGDRIKSLKEKNAGVYEFMLFGWKKNASATFEKMFQHKVAESMREQYGVTLVDLRESAEEDEFMHNIRNVKIQFARNVENFRKVDKYEKVAKMIYPGLPEEYPDKDDIGYRIAHVQFDDYDKIELLLDELLDNINNNLILYDARYSIKLDNIKEHGANIYVIYNTVTGDIDIVQETSSIMIDNPDDRITSISDFNKKYGYI